MDPHEFFLFYCVDAIDLKPSLVIIHIKDIFIFILFTFKYIRSKKYTKEHFTNPYKIVKVPFKKIVQFY